MSDAEALAFRARLGEYLEGFTADLESEAGRRHFCDYVSGLLGTAARKNMERIAFKANVPVRTLQDFLACYVWDEDAVRRRVQRLVAERHASADAIAIIDETGVPKKGAKTAGVQRQYCGARGKIENSVMFVGLAYAAGEQIPSFGQALAPCAGRNAFSGLGAQPPAGRRPLAVEFEGGSPIGHGGFDRPRRQ